MIYTHRGPQNQMEIERQTTTKKRATFLCTPLRDMISLSQIPGVGAVTHGRLLRAGMATPQQLVGQLMLLDRDDEAMKRWLKNVCAVREREAEVVVEALMAKTERVGLM